MFDLLKLKNFQAILGSKLPFAHAVLLVNGSESRSRHCLGYSSLLPTFADLCKDRKVGYKQMKSQVLLRKVAQTDSLSPDD